jgi:hypothetical protein
MSTSPWIICGARLQPGASQDRPKTIRPSLVPACLLFFFFFLVWARADPRLRSLASVSVQQPGNVGCMADVRRAAGEVSGALPFQSGGSRSMSVGEDCVGVKKGQREGGKGGHSVQPFPNEKCPGNDHKLVPGPHNVGPNHTRAGGAKHQRWRRGKTRSRNGSRFRKVRALIGRLVCASHGRGESHNLCLPSLNQLRPRDIGRLASSFVGV